VKSKHKTKTKHKKNKDKRTDVIGRGMTLYPLTHTDMMVIMDGKGKKHRNYGSLHLPHFLNLILSQV
jgi:hypothetical protein